MQAMVKRKRVLLDIFSIGVGIGCIILVVMKSRLVMTLEGDNCAQTYALFVDVAKALHSGEISLWNPYLWGGFPNAGHSLTQSCYPVNWILCNLFYNPETELVSYAVMVFTGMCVKDVYVPDKVFVLNAQIE